MDTPRKLQTIQPGSIPSEESFGTPTLWVVNSFAPEWFQDALHEARTGYDYHARRREILFAVCFAESYLVEWVRDFVLKRDFGKLNSYFPPDQRKTVTEKWKDVPKRLLTDNLIPAVPNLNQPYWKTSTNWWI